MTRSIGVYPGTFDPLHAGHLAFARQAVADCDLDYVVFLPEPSPRDKSNASPVAQRITQIEQTIAADNTLRCTQITSQQFSVAETLPQLLATFPGSAMTLLVGSDVAKGLHRWPDIHVLLRHMSLAIGLRQDTTHRDILPLIQTIERRHAITISHAFVRTDHSAVSSSQIRQKHNDLSR